MGGARLSALGLLLAALGGAAVGGVAGLVPGLHPNALAVLALAALPANPDGLAFAAGFAAMGLAHPMSALVPASFLGAPSADDALRALPAQALLREGRAGEAVQLATRGALLGALAGLALIVPLHLVLGPRGDGYRWLQPAIPLVLAAIAALLILTESASLPWRRAVLAHPFAETWHARVTGTLALRDGLLLRVTTPRGLRWVHDPYGLHDDVAVGAALAAQGPRVRVEARGSQALGVLAALGVFALAAGLGLAVQRLATPSPFGLPSSPMFPLLTGLFGAPSLLLALRAGEIPEQGERPVAPDTRDVVTGSVAGASCGALVGLLPGMSNSAASVLALLVSPREDREGVLITLSAAGAGAAVITAGAYVLLEKARSGVLLAVAEVAPPQPWIGLAPPPLLAALMLGCVVGAGLGALVALVAGRAAARVVHRVPYARLSAAVLAVLLALVAAFTGPWGLAVLAAATLVGLVPWRLGLRKGHLMGCTMGPLILGALAGWAG